MKNPLLTLLAVAVIGLLIGGYVFLSTAASERFNTPDAARTPSLVAGILCLGLATGLLVLGLLVFRKRE